MPGILHVPSTDNDKDMIHTLKYSHDKRSHSTEADAYVLMSLFNFLYILTISVYCLGLCT